MLLIDVKYFKITWREYRMKYMKLRALDSPIIIIFTLFALKQFILNTVQMTKLN